jgi:hypothetical protein
MQWLVISFNNINISVQVGDLIFYVATTSSAGGFDFSNAPQLLFGTVIEINGAELTVEYDDTNNPNPPPSAGDYIMFAKDQCINKSGIKGYYLKARFVNNHKHKGELYSVGTEVSESSK